MPTRQRYTFPKGVLPLKENCCHAKVYQGVTKMLRRVAQRLPKHRQNVNEMLFSVVSSFCPSLTLSKSLQNRRHFMKWRNEAHRVTHSLKFRTYSGSRAVIHPSGKQDVFSLHAKQADYWYGSATGPDEPLQQPKSDAAKYQTDPNPSKTATT